MSRMSGAGYLLTAARVNEDQMFKPRTAATESFNGKPKATV